MNRFDNAIHYNMALTGGFFAGYAVSNLLEIFGNAQTLNLLSIVRDAIIGDFPLLLLRLGGALVYMLGLLLSVIIPRFTRLRMDLTSLVIDALSFVVLAILPESMDIFVRVYPVFFATAFQWTAFDRIEGYVSATIFSTNNYRQFSTSLLSYIIDRDPKMLAKSRVFGFTLLHFHIGVAVSCLLSIPFGKLCSLFGLVPLAFALVLIMKNSE